MMYSTNISLNLISTIFKTINSSVDDTRKTLALFNKDWNTYKTNWQQGFASNGFAGGVKSIFQSTKSVVSSEQIQMLRTWNNAVKHGCTNQETFNKIIANADHNTKMYFAGLNKGKGTLDGLKNAQNATKASTIGLTIAQTALNMAISMGLTLAISAAIKGFDKMMNSAKRASEAADEAFEETSSKVQEQQEELKTLDELISKYKELKKDGTLDIEGRKEVKELQNDIADLVGTQAKNLDLVNGKLDDEIEKLNEISAKEAKTAYETATANYNNSQRAKDNATGDDSFLFDGWAYVGKREKDPENVLKEYGFGGSISNSRIAWWSNTQISDNFDKDGKQLKGAEEKRDYLQSMIDVLEQNGQRATELYSGLISQRDKYQQYIDNQQGAANSLVNSWITYSQYSNEELSKITVDSVESFETYRQKMIEAAKNDESVGKLLSDGTLSEKDLEVAVNDFMATSTKFSDWYKQWIGDVQGSTFDNKMTVSLSDLEGASDKIKALSFAFKELSEDGYITTKTMSEIKEATGLSDEAWSKYQSKLLNAKVGTAEFNQTMGELTYATLENKLGVDNLASADEEYIAAVLRENGVLDANAKAHEISTKAKFNAVLASHDFENASLGIVDVVYDELETMGLLKTATGDLQIAFAEAQNAMTKAVSEQVLNRLKLTKEEVEGIQSVADAYGVIGNSRRRTNAFGKDAFDGADVTPMSRLSEDEQAIVDAARAKAKIQQIINDIKYSGSSVNYSDSPSGSSSSSNDALDNYLHEAERRYKVHQNELTYISDLQYAYNNLTKTQEEQLDILDDIDEAYKDHAENQIKDIEHQMELLKNLYGEENVDLTPYYEQMQKIRENEANRLRAAGYDNNSNEVQEQQSGWWEDEAKKVDELTKQHEKTIRNLEHSMKLELEANPFADTTEFYKSMQEFNQ